jgi:hypothetical protein
MTRFFALESLRRLATRSCAAWLPACLTACAIMPQTVPNKDEPDPVKAAFVVLGEGGRRIARVITGDVVCPSATVDGVARDMQLRAAPQILPLRPTRSDPADSKPSAFPVRVCEMTLPAAAFRASVGGHTLAVPSHDPKRIVIIGDSGCRIKRSDGTFQACNDSGAWPFAQVAAAAAAMKPDLVIHVGDYQYRENACPAGNAGCAGSPWGYGWDTWDADFFAPAQSLLAAAPWVFVRGNHESCNRAGQGWWRLLDPRPLSPMRDCNDPANDERGDYSEPYTVPLSSDTQLIVFDSSRVGTDRLAPTDPMYLHYEPQFRRALDLSVGVAHNLFVDHHPILGFATDPTHPPDGVYPGNESLQSVLAAIGGQRLFPPNIDVLLSGHDHLFEVVSFESAHPVQLISGNGGAWADAPLPGSLTRGAAPAPGAIVDTIVSTNRYGFTIFEPAATTDGVWRVQARDRRGRLLTTCMLSGRQMRCTPSTLQ